MKKISLLIISLFFTNFIKAQEVFDIPNNLKDSYQLVRDIYTIDNQATKNLTLFLDDNKTFNAYIYNKNFERLAELSSEGLPNRYDKIIGYIQKQNKTILFLKNRNDKEFGAIVFDFDSKTTEEIKFDIKFKNEEYLEGISRNNKFYIISIERNTSTLNFYEFNDHQYLKQKINLDYHFTVDSNKYSNLYEMLEVSDMMHSRLEIQKIKNIFPVSMEMASSVNKIYENEIGFDLTLDKSKNNTYLISIDLENYSHQIKEYTKPKLSSTNKYHTNSFLLEDKIYQLIANSDKLLFNVWNRETFKLLKEISLQKNEEIKFKNTPIIQDKEDDIYAPHRELEKTAKFLRKINNDNIAISVYRTAFGYQITMGSYNEITHSHPLVGMPGTPAMQPPIGHNLTNSAYFSYSFGKSVRIECLFDKKFQHLDGEPRQNVFDKIKDYSENVRKNESTETVFEWNNDIYYGYYFQGIESYRIVKF